MTFRRPHPNRISRGLASNRELELEQVNQALRDDEVSINRSNEKYINELERKYIRCEKEIQSLNKELEQLEDASEEEKPELRSEISSLKRSLYQATKEIQVISSWRSSPSLYNSEEEDTDMANLDLFIQIDRGLNHIENHLRGGTPLNNPTNIIQGIRDANLQN
ncbi:8264_t:CDS:2 [Paraglomus brasilianum]|uniref:8264_t:CDS:1 n=1 Tax=Paraglomus brasilianum TaxID=144538 RepID=A0A9N8W3R9_9GLOM|nr:8264_t:CDS:2 [Paraglomus brasilianum]